MSTDNADDRATDGRPGIDYALVLRIIVSDANPSSALRNFVAQEVEARTADLTRELAEAHAGLVAAMEGLADAKESRVAAINATPDPLTGRHSTLAAFALTSEIRAALAADHGAALAARVARIKAEALREVANECRYMPADPEKAARWLRARADHIEADQ